MILRFFKTGTTSYYDLKCRVAFGSNWWVSRPNQESVMTLDGTISTMDISPTLVKGNIIIKGGQMLTSNTLRDFFETVTVFRLYSFTVQQFKDDYTSYSSGSGVDFGKGKGITLTTVYLDIDEASTEGMFEFVPPGFDNINIPYFFRR